MRGKEAGGQQVHSLYCFPSFSHLVVLVVFWGVFVVFPETGSHYVDQAGLRFRDLPLLPDHYWLFIFLS